MALSDSRRRANDKYIADHYSRIALSMPNDEADALRQYCSAHGLTVAGFIRGLIRDAISAGSVQASPAAAAADPVQASAGAGLGSPGGAALTGAGGQVTPTSTPKE